MPRTIRRPPPTPRLFIIGLVVAAPAVLLFSSFKIVGQAEVMVIERFGRFSRLARSGLNILLLLIERPRTIDVLYAH